MDTDDERRHWTTSQAEILTGTLNFHQLGKTSLEGKHCNLQQL
jgi:hypothetical protein